MTKKTPASLSPEESKLLRWIVGWTADYRVAKEGGDDSAMLEVANDLVIAAGRLQQIAEENGV